MRNSANFFNMCPSCGRTLEIGEACNCDQPVKGLPRDGLRAKCPLFKHRSSYRLKYYICCRGNKTRYEGSDQRNEHYRLYCCEAWRACAIYQDNQNDEGRILNER